MSEEVADIWAEFELETQANQKMASGHQLMFEQSIGNIAALKMLNDTSVEEAVKN